ncbi:hypothetical protein V1L54_20620 [Streptomyces sp. TRM 70361]|uniref:hypothetical protein n=1 Tax=Streptomyces sp. TRM 70361 TaxID=3116553 RepID=UPI002E7BEBAF|nr:hypothetical protein [Streptomyces sp. TRM 70361]MEE1941777.1 hypothetical protein [Streptomyces sp. TRM 70361]
MSDEQQERPDEPNVAPLLVFTDLRRNGMFLPFGLGGAMRAGVMGSTDFEGKDLEEMLDLVEDARPGEIENAANALWDAAGKIKEIGDDLRTHIDRVDWEGEFGDNFRAWGRDLSKNTLVLADYTEQASIHLKAAGAGLATVRSAMPKRDASVLGAPKVEAIPAEERVETNERYRLAKKKEEDRQEAINQMNRLASYYTVSHDNMRAAEEPRFGPMPRVGVPPERPVRQDGSGSSRQSSRGSAEEYRAAEPVSQAGERRESTVVRGTVPEGKHTVLVPDGGTTPGRDVRTDLNTVALVAPPTTDPGPRTPFPTTGGGGTGPAQMAPLPLTHNGPLNNNRSGGGGGPRNAGPYQGIRSGAQGPLGNTSNIPPGNGNGPARPVTGAGPVSGAPQGSQPPAGRPNTGVFGGTPQAQRGGVGSSHLPRGTVVGTEHGMTGRPPAGATGASAIGAGNNNPGRKQTAPAPGGITGAPRQAPAPGGTARPFTPGGTGLTRGGTADGGRNPTGMAARTGSPGPREESRNESRRPDYLTEDEETWTVGRNNTVPPVID